MEHSALIVVDMQNYYLQAHSDFHRFCEQEHPGAMNYIAERTSTIVVPALQRLLQGFRASKRPIIFLRLCGTDPGRKDLHRFFRESWERGLQQGFPNIYPLCEDPMSAVIDEIAPLPGEDVVTKTTFSGFTGNGLEEVLRAKRITTLFMAGLATSQCVETTARDASDRGFHVVHVEDAQADYSETSHHASLYSSAGVCGGDIRSTSDVLNQLAETKPGD